MENLTGDMLIAFGEANGLRIMSHRDPDRWAEMVNAKGGICPCGKECPCDECTCKFYEAITQNTDDEGDVIITNDEIKMAVETLEEAKIKLMTVTKDDDEKASKEMEEAAMLIKTDAGKHNCGKCEEAMNGIARKIEFLSGECKQDSLSCLLETESTLRRIEQMQQIFIGIDESMSNGDESTTSNEDENNRDPQLEAMRKQEDIEQAEKRDKMLQGFHGCVSRKMEAGFDGDMTRQEKFCTATKLCAKNSIMTEEEAIASCMKEKKNDD